MFSIPEMTANTEWNRSDKCLQLLPVPPILINCYNIMFRYNWNNQNCNNSLSRVKFYRGNLSILNVMPPIQKIRLTNKEHKNTLTERNFEYSRPISLQRVLYDRLSRAVTTKFAKIQIATPFPWCSRHITFIKSLRIQVIGVPKCLSTKHR